MARVLIFAGGALLLLGLVLGGIQGWQRYQAAVQRQQVDRYTAGILPFARSAGKLVGVSVVPELRAYDAGQLSGAAIASQAPTWRGFFSDVRFEFDGVPHPGALGQISADFDKALREYAAAVTYFEQLGGSSPASALQAGRLEARRADSDYAHAAGQLACLRESLGLPPLAEFRAQGSCPGG